MKRLLTALIFLIGSALIFAAEERPADASFQVHGRLSLYNGNPGFRIWVVGTKRILGVAESPPEVPIMPARLFDLAVGANLVFGDFTVVPLTKDEPGVMRMVRVVCAEHVVITDGNLNVIRRIDTSIKEEANHPAEPASPSKAGSP